MREVYRFLAVDLIITAVVVMIFVTREAPRHQMANWWIYVVATLLIGPCFALPLFLFFREGQIEALASTARSSTQRAWS